MGHGGKPRATDLRAAPSGQIHRGGEGKDGGLLTPQAPRPGATREAPDLPRSPDSKPTWGGGKRENPRNSGPICTIGTWSTHCFCFYYFYLFFYLAVLGLSCSTRGLCLQHNSQLQYVGSSCLTWGGRRAAVKPRPPCIGSTES